MPVWLHVIIVLWPVYAAMTARLLCMITGVHSACPCHIRVCYWSPAWDMCTKPSIIGVSHYDDVIMTTMTSQITSLTIVYSTVYSDADQREHQSSASLAFVWGIHRGPVNSPHKWPVTRKMFPFDNVIMEWVLHGEDVAAYFINERITTGKTNIGRVFVNDDLVVGKVVPHLNRFYSVHPSGTSDVRLDTGYEKVAVDASGSVTWVWYNATKGQPLPTGALIGSYVAATGTPLYVSRLMPTNDLLVVGYYNPQNRKAWGQFHGIKCGATFEVMVIQSL